MVPYNVMKELSTKTDSKILLLIIDGLGGVPNPDKTALEAAQIPNLHALAKESTCGLINPISPGITPGSGPAHLAVFGYDPLEFQIGRGVLEALGIGLGLTGKDLATRGNFATMDASGTITDRRAGRIATEKNVQICTELQEKIKKVDDVEIIVKPGKEHRFVIVFRGEGLQDGLSDTDPQKEGLKAKKVEPATDGAKKAANIINKFMEKANEVLKSHHPANTLLLRGIAKVPNIPSMNELFKLNPAAIATYPMYKGLARLVGMEILETGDTIADEFETLKNNIDKHDFFYLHIKKTDSYGEDGNLANKIKILEELDKQIPKLKGLKLDVITVTGDHSTPSLMKSHSWHPNPIMINSKYIIKDDVDKFTEKECAKGGFGIFYSKDVMTLMLANALKLNKFGA